MLKRILKRFKVGQKGFTLIELLVVVAILGVLAAVAIPNVVKFMGTGKLTAANTELSTVIVAQAGYMADNNGTATTDQDLLLPYVSQGTLTGVYTFDADGNLTDATYDDFTLDSGTKQFK
jgi:prepilin-type N-terminal cleavage/methylation domain-containing protein